MDLEKLYQNVWAQVFAATWWEMSEAQVERAAESKKEADLAAEAALKAWDPAKAHAAICAAQGLTPIEAAAAQEGK